MSPPYPTFAFNALRSPSSTQFTTLNCCIDTLRYDLTPLERMLNSSLRRVARTCPSASVPTRYISPTNSSKPVVSFSTHCHQRRHSSSKPPTPPNNGSSSIPAASVKQVGTPKSSDKRAGTEARLHKRKHAKDEKMGTDKEPLENKGNNQAAQLPSVPSTQHLNSKDLNVAAFFSTYRPLTISGPLPPETQIEDIEKIFRARPKRSRNGPTEVMYTLSSAVQNLNEHIHRVQQGQHQSEHHRAEQGADLVKILTRHNRNAGNGNNATQLDAQAQPPQEIDIQISLEEIARRFRPFRAPPPPVPVPGFKFFADGQDSSALQTRKPRSTIRQRHSQRTASRVVKVRRPRDPRLGQFFFTSRPIVSEPTPSVSITEPSKQPSKGVKIRRGMYVDPKRKVANLKYFAISVKRQRKLKMKKHKYKKLMRKTRNLRRRQDRL